MYVCMYVCMYLIMLHCTLKCSINIFKKHASSYLYSRGSEMNL